MNRLLKQFIIPKLITNNRATFSTTANANNSTQAVSQQPEIQGERQVEVQQEDEDKTDYKAEYSAAQYLLNLKKHSIDPKEMEMMLQNLGPQEEDKKYIAENGWNKVAPHLVIPDQTFVSPSNRVQMVKLKLKEYQAALSPKLIKKFQERIYNENFYKSRQAQLFMRKLNPVSQNYLKQGYSLLNPHSLVKLIENRKHKIIGQLLQYGIFQQAPVVDCSIAAFIIQQVHQDQRNEYLLNLLVFNEYLFDNPITQQILESYELKEDVFIEIEGLIYVSTHLNKLRLLWSYHKLYAKSTNYSQDILGQLFKTYIKTGSGHQEAIKKQIYILLHSHYQKNVLQKFYLNLMKAIPNYNDFMKTYGLSLILLSKLKSIKKILPQKDSNELHSIFQLIQLNLPKQISQLLLENVVELLSNQDHSKIQYQNFKRSYNFWLKDYTQPQKTVYHSELSKLLEKEDSQLMIYYESYINTESYAKTMISLKRNKALPKQEYRTKQIEVIRNILQRNYEPVLNNFITTFHFGAESDTSKRFTDRLKETDRNKSFYNKQEESLYKLKLAHEVFLNRSLPHPLGEVNLMQNQKQNYYNLAIFSEDELEYDDDMANFQAMYKFNMGEQIIGKMADFQDRQLSKQIEVEEQQLEQAVQPALLASQPNQDGQIQSLQAIVVQQPAVLEQLEQAVAQQVEQVTPTPKASDQTLIRDTQFFLSYNFDLSQLKDMFEKQSPVYRKDFISQDDQQFSSQSYSEQDHQNVDKISNKERQFYVQNKAQYPNQEEQEEIQMKKVRFSKKKFFGTQEAINQQKIIENQAVREAPQQVNIEDSVKNNNEESVQKQNVRQNKKKTSVFKNKNQDFNNKNKFQFSTLNTLEKVQQQPQNPFTIQKVNELKTQKIDKSFLKLLKQQQHIPSIGSGTTIAKYLFLHGKNNSKNISLSSNKTLNIEFTSVMGLHNKNYQKYLTNNLYNYQLQTQFYEQLLEDQLQVYNRLHFKQIIVHIINFKVEISDKIIQYICKIAIKQRIGYTFVQIAHLIKQNKFKLSPAALATIARTWQKFDILNEDLLNFIRQYCRKYDMGLKRQYYELFCKSLIKTKKYDKLQLIVSAILIQLQPKAFKLQSHMVNLKRQQITIIQKEWKSKQQKKFIQNYLQLLDVIVSNLDDYIPEFYANIFSQYRKINPVLNEKELGYAFICYSWKKERIEELLEILSKQSEKGTSFMYDCLLKSFLNNFQELQDISQKMLDVTVVKNRIKLSNDQIKKSLIIFKKSLTSNAFSKFLEHCLRFQEEINQSHQIKREMYYILNNNVEDVSVGGIFNLLDFIFNQKREKERVQYRQIKISEEEKERKLLEIQKNVTKASQNAVVHVQNSNKEVKDKKKKKQSKKQQDQEDQVVKVSEQKVEAAQKSQAKQAGKKDTKQVVSKKQIKKNKKLKSQQKLNKNQIVEQMITQRDTNKQKHTNALQNDEEIVGQIKSQGIRNQSYKRKNLKSMSSLYDAVLQIDKQEQEQRAKQLQKKDEKGKQFKGKGKGKKDDKKGKK